jgi:hypothetical protein
MRRTYFHVSNKVSSCCTWAREQVYVTVFAMGTEVEMVNRMDQCAQGNDWNILQVRLRLRGLTHVSMYPLGNDWNIL